MDEALLVTLRTHDPWPDRPQAQPELLAATLPERYVPRRKRLELRAGRVELVVEPQQAGKPTWIRHTLAELGEPVLILNCEEPRIRDLGRSPALTAAALEGLLEPRANLFFAEVQHLADAGLFLKGLVDLEPRRRIVATGSSSFALRGRTRESLAGRARRTVLLPLSIDEVAAGGGRRRH